MGLRQEPEDPFIPGDTPASWGASRLGGVPLCMRIGSRFLKDGGPAQEFTPGFADLAGGLLHAGSCAETHRDACHAST